jgi:hypothetical protein
MTDKTTEELHRDWVDAVADANTASDALREAKDDYLDSRDDEALHHLESELEQAKERADVCYRAYLDRTATWITDAPRCFSFLVSGSPAVSADGESVLPSVSLAFRGDNTTAPITVTFIASEMQMRRFQRDLGKQIDAAITQSRELTRGQ